DCNANSNMSGSVFLAGVNPGLIIQSVIGYNPGGPSPIIVGASPFTYTAGPTHEVVYIYGGTVSNIAAGGLTLGVSSPASVILFPNQGVTVTYSVAPTMVKDRK